MLEENPPWGSDRIVGALSNLGIRICDTTVDNIRKRNGLEPAPLRMTKINWDTFLKAHWEGLLAADFFTTEVLCLRGMVRFYTLFVIYSAASSFRNWEYVELFSKERFQILPVRTI